MTGQAGTVPTSGDSTNQPRIFISYSSRGNGQVWRDRLLRALHIFEEQHLLDVWQDGKIRVSAYWDDDIKQAMHSAQLAIVLLTPETFTSEYILNTEFPYLRDRQQHDRLPIFPVICEPCNWRSHDWLHATQAPNASNPLSSLSEAEQDRVFRKLANDIAETVSRIALARLSQSVTPLPPDRIFLDQFPLPHCIGQRDDKLIGREGELALLNLAFTQPHTAIVSLVAWGGVGKSMLVQHWLQRLQREHWHGIQRVYAWSFFSQGSQEDRQASEDMFLAHALEWFGVRCDPTVSPLYKGRLLAEAIESIPTLLVLDGIEPLQFPPGPMGGKLHAPGMQSLLKHLARKSPVSEHHGLCLVTTREPLTDLGDFQRREGSAWGSVLRVNLGNLADEAGAALLHHTGANRAGAADINADDTELLAASREVDGHALTLNLLGRFLARAYQGDIRRRGLVQFEEADRKVQGGTTFKMLAAFENWFNRGGFYQQSLAILRILGLFDRPADIGCLTALQQLPVIEGLTDPLFTSEKDTGTRQMTAHPLEEEEWNTATSFLADFGLVVMQADANNNTTLLDCHPLIREYFAKIVCETAGEAWRVAHLRVYEHLLHSTDDYPDTLQELEPLYQAIRHGCCAHEYDAALNLFQNRIRRRNQGFSFRQLGAYTADLHAISAFFVTPWSQAYRDGQFWLLNEAAYVLKALGRLDEAVEPFRISIALCAEGGDWRQAAIRANNLSEIECILGNLEQSEAYARQGVDFAQRGLDRFWAIASASTLAEALSQQGKQSAAAREFARAENELGLYSPQYTLLYSLPGYRYATLLLGDAELAAWKCGLSLAGEFHTLSAHDEDCEQVEERARQTLKIANTNQWLLHSALDELTLCRVALYQAIYGRSQGATISLRRDADAKLQYALSHLAVVIEHLRLAGEMTYLPAGLLTLAWAYAIERDLAKAQTELDEAWDIAERGAMRLLMADIHLYRARLFFRDRLYPWESPEVDLAAAEKLINNCGYHRRDEELTDAKNAILGM